MAREVTGRSFEVFMELNRVTGTLADHPQKFPEECPNLRWYAVHTRSRHEKSVSQLLGLKRFPTFLPLYETLHRWKNGDHRIQLPLFPGYTFVRLDVKDCFSVLKVAGVARLIGFNGTPTPLPDEEIELLRNTLNKGVRAMPHPYLIVGRRARITAGPLAGREGILVRRKGEWRMILSIDLIQRSILVDIEANALEPA